ncbi:MAG: hypothetical protein ACJAYF_000526 [Arenicella sp.]
MKIQKIYIVLTLLLLSVFAGSASANCQDVPAAPTVLSNDVLTNTEIELLKPEFDAFLVQLDSLLSCIRAQSDALTPAAIDLTLEEGQEPVVDLAFIAASQALSDAMLHVGQLEETSIQRFNYLVENAQADSQPAGQSSTNQP